MENINENLGTIIGISIAVFALLISILAWLFPRQPKNRSIASFNGELTSVNEQKFARFLREHDEKIVKVSIQVAGMNQDLLNEWEVENERTYHSLTLKTGASQGDCISEIEVTLEPEKGSNYSPVYFAYGGHNINGFFLIRVIPGFRMGCGQVRMTEVSAEQMALRR